MSEQHLSTKQYQRAIQIVEEIEKLEAELKAVLSAGGSTPATETPEAQPTKKGRGKGKGKKKRAGRVLSPEARERMAAGQRARWAKTKQG